jgi:integrase
MQRLTQTKDGWTFRLRCGAGQHPRLRIRLTDRAAAQVRAEKMAELSSMLVRVGKSREAIVILRHAAEATSDAEFDDVVGVAHRECGNVESPKPSAVALTFEKAGRSWTSGELHRRYPDHVKLKRSAGTDAKRLEKLYATIGDVPLAAFSLAHAEKAMAALPPNISPATRRQYGQLMARLLKLAVYPLKAVERSPLPSGFLPKGGAKKAKAFLYPAEDATLLACLAIPVTFRLLYGFLAREGARYSEAARLTWGDLDLKRGAVTLDVNKTDDPRAWVLTPGVAEALAAHRPDDSGDDALVFARAMADKAAVTFREHLRLAGVDRAELFRRSASRIPIRVHDLRGTFVTLSLAEGRSEAWVADRTGHRSSQMINAYRRAARTASELTLGPLKPLNVALGLCQGVFQRYPGGDDFPKEIMVGHEGLEPSTNGLRIHCSTN